MLFVVCCVSIKVRCLCFLFVDVLSDVCGILLVSCFFFLVGVCCSLCVVCWSLIVACCCCLSLLFAMCVVLVVRCVLLFWGLYGIGWSSALVVVFRCVLHAGCSCVAYHMFCQCVVYCLMLCCCLLPVVCA